MKKKPKSKIKRFNDEKESAGGVDPKKNQKPKTPKKKPSPFDFFTRLVKSDLKLEAVKEYRFHPVRRWRFDYAIIEHKIAIEVEGGVFTQGRHTRPLGFLGDIEKYNTATTLGWSILRVTPDSLISRSTLDLIRETIKSKQLFSS